MTEIHKQISDIDSTNRGRGVGGNFSDFPSIFHYHPLFHITPQHTITHTHRNMGTHMHELMINERLLAASLLSQRRHYYFYLLNTGHQRIRSYPFGQLWK